MKRFERLRPEVVARGWWTPGVWRPLTTIAGRRDHAASRRALREITSLAWPITMAMLGETAMGVVDTKLVAALGAGPLGGVGLGVTLMYLNFAFVFGLVRGVKVCASHAMGEGRPGLAVDYARAGVWLCAALGLVAFALGRDASWLLHAAGVDPALVPYARDFLAARTWGAPATCIVAALVQYRQGVGDSRTPMLVGLGGNVVNAGLAYAWIHGRAGLPALGVAGAGYATAVSEWLEAAVLLALLVRAHGARGRDPRAARVGLREAVQRLAVLGLPLAAQFGLEALAFATFTAILGSISATEIAANQVAMATIRLSFLPGLAVAEACSVCVGRALGRRQLRAADRYLRTGLVLAAGFMSVCGVGFALGGGALARAFTPDAAVAEVARRLLLVAAVFQALDAATIVLRAALRAAKDVRVVALMGIAIVWGCLPVAAYLLGRLAGWGAVGGWCGFILETTVSIVVFGRRWRSGPWRLAYARA